MARTEPIDLIKFNFDGSRLAVCSRTSFEIFEIKYDGSEPSHVYTLELDDGGYSGIKVTSLDFDTRSNLIRLTLSDFRKLFIEKVITEEDRQETYVVNNFALQTMQ